MRECWNYVIAVLILASGTISTEFVSGNKIQDYGELLAGNRIMIQPVVASQEDDGSNGDGDNANSGGDGTSEEEESEENEDEENIQPQDDSKQGSTPQSPPAIGGSPGLAQDGVFSGNAGTVFLTPPPTPSTTFPPVASIPPSPAAEILTPPPTPDYEEPINEICNNGVDDDGDGSVDENDCIPEPPPPEICDNEVDDDGDGTVDEEGCLEVESKSEPSTPTPKLTLPPVAGIPCPNVFPLPAWCDTVERLPEICDNGIDDDSDGMTDEQNCITPPLTPAILPTNPAVERKEACNLRDDDGDGTVDEGCPPRPIPTTTPPIPPLPPTLPGGDVGGPQDGEVEQGEPDGGSQNDDPIL